MTGRATVGLDIGTSGVRAAEVSLRRGVATLERFGQVALPPGAVVGGEVVDQEAVAGALRRLWRDAKFSSRRVSLGVSNQKVVVRQVDLVWMEQNELKKALGFQVQDYIPIPVDEAVLDFHPIEEFTSDDGARMIRVLLVAAARSMVMENLAAVRQAGLKPAMVDLTPFALLRSAVHAGGFAMDSAATAIVDVGAQVTNIVVHQNGVPKFVRILLMGGADLTNALAERLGVPPEQAETVKQQFSGPGDLSNPLTNPGGRALEASSSALVEEIRGSLDYYRAAPGSVPISRLLLTGGSSRLDLLAQRLSDAIRVQVEPGGVVGKLGLGKTGLSEEQLRYIDPLATVSVGLALGVAS